VPLSICRAEKSSHRYLIEPLHAKSLMHSTAKTYFASELKAWSCVRVWGERWIARK